MIHPEHIKFKDNNKNHIKYKVIIIKNITNCHRNRSIHCVSAWVLIDYVTVYWFILRAFHILIQSKSERTNNIEIIFSKI